MKPSLIVLCLCVAAFRAVLLFVDFNQHVDKGYEALAHGLVFSLLTVGYVLNWVSWRFEWFAVGGNGAHWCHDNGRWLVRAGWLLTLVEIVCASLAFAMKKGVL